MHTLLQVSQPSAFNLAMLVESASFVFKDAGSIKQEEEEEVENILAPEVGLCCMLLHL